MGEQQFYIPEGQLSLDPPVIQEDEEEPISNGFYIPEGQTSLGEKENLYLKPYKLYNLRLAQRLSMI